MKATVERFDFDILATTSNKEIINGVFKNEYPVVYDPPKPEKKICTDEDLYKADLFSFGSIIGSITNKSSNGYALLPNIEKTYGKDSPEYKLTLQRLQQCCKAQSCQIDKAKIGREVKGIPSIWVQYQRTDNPEKDEFYNRILLDRYPYFFKYRYKEARTEFRRHHEENNITSLQKFGKTIDSLMTSARKTPEESAFVENYIKYMPVTYSDSPVNLLCRYIESVNFDLNKKLKATPFSDYWLYKNHNFSYTDDEYKRVVAATERYMKSYKQAKALSINDDSLKDFALKSELSHINSNIYVIINCLVDYFYEERPSAGKNILWESYGKYIFKNIKKNSERSVEFPFHCEDGDIEYMGKKYKLRECDLI